MEIILLSTWQAEFAKLKSFKMRNFLFVSIVLCGLCRSAVFAQSVTQYVNPFMGTTTLWTPEDLGYIRTVEKRPWEPRHSPEPLCPMRWCS